MMAARPAAAGARPSRESRRFGVEAAGARCGENSGVVTAELDERHAEAAVALWDAMGLTRPWNDAPADFARALRGPSSAVLGGFEGEALVGTAMVGHDGHRGWVYYLAVAREAQGEGRGRAIMAACEAWLRERDIPKAQPHGSHGQRRATGVLRRARIRRR